MSRIIQSGITELEAQRELVVVVGNGLVNLLFGAYLWFVQPVIMRRLAFVQERDAGDSFLAGLLLALPLFEFAGLLLKRPLMLHFAARYPRRGSENWQVFLWVMTPILHLAAASLLPLAAFSLLGVGPMGSASAGWQTLVVLVVFLVIFKESILIVMMFPYGALSPPQKTPTAKKLQSLEEALRGKPAETLSLGVLSRSWLGDILLLSFSAPVYTIVWISVFGQSSLNSSSQLLLYLGASVCFFVIYLSTRGVYVMYEVALQRTQYQRWASGISLLVVWVSALFNIPGVL